MWRRAAAGEMFGSGLSLVSSLSRGPRQETDPGARATPSSFQDLPFFLEGNLHILVFSLSFSLRPSLCEVAQLYGKSRLRRQRGWAVFADGSVGRRPRISSVR